MSILQLLPLLLSLSVYPGHAQSVNSRAGNVSPADNYIEDLSTILDSVVTHEGLVRYDVLRGPSYEQFRRVLKTVEEYNAAELHTQDEKLAFWLNAYNVQMLQHIIEHPEITRVIEGDCAEKFFNTPYRTARKAVTLDQIEHVILRGKDGPDRFKQFQLQTLDPRIHVGLNCAAVSCPRLRQQAFTPENVDLQLDRAMRDFTADPRHFRLEGDTVVVSALLDWFGEDFNRSGVPAGNFLLEYMPSDRPNYERLKSSLEGKDADQLRKSPDIRFAYDWTVNAVRAGNK